MPIWVPPPTDWLKSPGDQANDVTAEPLGLPEAHQRGLALLPDGVPLRGPVVGLIGLLAGALPERSHATSHARFADASRAG